MQSNTSAVLDTKTTHSQTSTKQSTTSKTNVSFYETAAYEFRNKYEQPLGLTTSSLNLQQNLIDEEHLELAHAFLLLKQDITNKRARAHMLKELADLTYVIHQMAACFGWDLQTAYNRVHGSNMSKLGEDGKPIHREDGKILKGPNYYEPELIDLV
jgi:predicted HAD superfamily Cof-like phosphohydrolase